MSTLSEPLTLDAPPATLDERLTRAIDRAAEWSLARQDASGFWSAPLQTNCCMEAQWLLAMHFLGIERPDQRDALVRAILHEQRDDGSWEVYYHAPAGDINTTVECYAALRAVGFSPDDERLCRARAWIFDHGGLSRLRVFTRYWLALLGEWPWEATPTLPPELILLPNWFPLSIYRFSQWARATMVPLCILSARRPVRSLPEGRRLDELFPEGRERFDFRMNLQTPLFSLDRLFLWADRVLSRYVRFPFHPGREASIRLCLEWIIKHQDADGVWGGIQPPWIYSLLALATEGYPATHPVSAKGLNAVDAQWSVRRDDRLYIQASDSIVWDTALTLLALADCGRRPDDTPAMIRAADWLLDQQVFAPGDWQVAVPGVEPGGWAFERANLSYPDCDDTAVVLQALLRLKNHLPQAERTDAAIRRGLDWLAAMQCRDGGWAAFDKDNTTHLVTKIPFCDFGEVLDPPSADVTAHVVETLVLAGGDRAEELRRGLDYLLVEQEEDGSWFGRWGVNHVYGTGAALPALAAMGLRGESEPVERAAGWLVEHQNADGGWGETPGSYMDDALRGRGDSTASQTAWALMALLAAEDESCDAAIRRGLEFLIHSQLSDGTWDEPQFTGAGFPGYGLGARLDPARKNRSARQGTELERGFMLNYNLYRHYFPLMALGRAKAWLEGKR